VNSAPPPFGLSAEVIRCAPPASQQSGASAFADNDSDDAGVLAEAPARVPLASAYVRSQVAAALATLMDFGCMVLLVEAVHMHYVLATACGSLVGGATAFVTNRHWSFRAGHLEVSPQMLRYAVTWLGSLTLNCVLVYAMTEEAGLTYTLSKAVTAVLVGACFNFPLHRYYVFR